MFVTGGKKKKSKAPHQHPKETMIRELEKLERSRTRDWSDLHYKRTWRRGICVCIEGQVFIQLNRPLSSNG